MPRVSLQGFGNNFGSFILSSLFAHGWKNTLSQGLWVHLKCDSAWGRGGVACWSMRTGCGCDMQSKGKNSPKEGCKLVKICPQKLFLSLAGVQTHRDMELFRVRPGLGGSRWEERGCLSPERTEHAGCSGSVLCTSSLADGSSKVTRMASWGHKDHTLDTDALPCQSSLPPQEWDGNLQGCKVSAKMQRPPWKLDWG